MLIPVGYALWSAGYKFSDDAEWMYTTCGVDVSDWGGAYADGLEYISDSWVGCLNGSMSDEVEQGNYSLAVGQDGGDPITYTYTEVEPGAASSFPMWPNSAVLVKKQTASGGRRNRGRMFVPGLAIRSLVTPGGIIDSAFLADLQTNLDVFLAGLEEGTLFAETHLVVLHSEAPSTPARITSLVADSKLATQRRRMRP